MTLISLDPLLIEFQIPQNDLEDVFQIEKALLDMLGENNIEGEITYISKIADQTRQFTAEVSIQNPDNKFPGGLSAGVTIPYKTQLLTYIPASFIVLNENTGETGVKVVNKLNKVEFAKIEIIESDENGFFVQGLEPDMNIISLGQGFVKTGQEVQPIKNKSED